MNRRLFRIAFLCVLILFVAPGQDCPGSGPPQGSVFLNYDVLAYEYTFDVETGDATSFVTLESLTAGNCVTLDYRVPDDGTAPIWNGVPAEWSRYDTDVLEVCGQDTPSGDIITLETGTHILRRNYYGSDVGFSAIRNADGDLEYYLLSWFEGCSYFGPCYDDPDDFAEFTFHVSHPSGYQLLCPGTLTPGDTLSTCSFTMDGGPTYTGFGFLVSPSWQKVPLGTAGKVSIDLYDLASLDMASVIDTQSYLGYFQWLEATLTSYPFGNVLRFNVGPYYWWGFEHPGNIALAESLLEATGSYYDPVLHVMMHETAHMWAGNEVTLASIYDFVWKEAMAEYLTFVYEDEQLASNYGTRTLAVWKSNSVGVSYYPVPEEKPELAEYYGDVYGPGPMILFRQLEVLLGREAVVTAIRSVLGGPRFIGIADIQEALEVNSGVALGEYFDEWVYGMGAPVWPTVDVAYSVDPDAGLQTVKLTQTQNNGVYYGFGTTVRLLGQKASDTLDVHLSFGVTGSETTQVTVTPRFTVTGYELDPYREALVFETGTASARLETFEFRPF